MNDDKMKTKKEPPTPVLNRRGRRALKRGRLKMIRGGRPPDAPSVDMTQPAGRFAHAIHGFMVRYLAANPDLEPSAVCAAALHVAAAVGVDLGGNADEFSMAAAHFFTSEAEARPRPPPPSGAAG